MGCQACLLFSLGDVANCISQPSRAHLGYVLFFSFAWSLLLHLLMLADIDVA